MAQTRLGAFKFISVVLVSCLVFTCGCGNKTALGDIENQIVSGDYAGAIDALNELKDISTNRQALRLLGIASMEMSDYEGAINSFSQALSNSDGRVTSMDLDINYYLASAYMKSDNLAEAKACYDAICAIDDTQRDAFFLRAMVELKDGHSDESFADIDKAIALNPNDYDFLVNAYKLLSEYGYRSAGETYLLSALETGAESMSNLQKGKIYYYLQNYEQARDCLEMARSELDAEVCLYLGRAYEALGDYNYAISVYSDYIARDNVQPMLYNQLGLCQMRLGQYEQALASFESGMRLEDTSLLKELSYNEIIAYEYLGDFKQAAVLMNRYVETYPSDEEASREYIFLKSR